MHYIALSLIIAGGALVHAGESFFWGPPTTTVIKIPRWCVNLIFTNKV
jgi:hypothetical protein